MKEKGIYFDKENKKRYEKRTETEWELTDYIKKELHNGNCIAPVYCF
jgi:hypothetical protein